MRFRTCSIRILYRAGSLIAAVRELARNKLDIVGVQEARWDKGDSERAGDYIFLMEQETKIIKWEQDCLYTTEQCSCQRSNFCINFVHNCSLHICYQQLHHVKSKCLRGTQGQADDVIITRLFQNTPACVEEFIQMKMGHSFVPSRVCGQVAWLARSVRQQHGARQDA